MVGPGGILGAPLGWVAFINLATAIALEKNRPRHPEITKKPRSHHTTETRNPRGYPGGYSAGYPGGYNTTGGYHGVSPAGDPLADPLGDHGGSLVFSWWSHVSGGGFVLV